MQEILIDQRLVKLHIKTNETACSFQIPTVTLVKAIDHYMDEVCYPIEIEEESQSMWHNHFPNPDEHTLIVLPLSYSSLVVSLSVEYINPKVSYLTNHLHPSSPYSKDAPNPAKTPLNDRDLASDNTSLRQYPMTPDECYPFKHLSNDPDSVLYCPLAGLNPYYNAILTTLHQNKQVID